MTFASFISDCYHNNRQVNVITTYFSEAFVTIDHHLLGLELEALCIEKSLLPCLKFYISERRQFIKVNEDISNLIQVTGLILQQNYRFIRLKKYFYVTTNNIH